MAYNLLQFFNIMIEWFCGDVKFVIYYAALMRMKYEICVSSNVKVRFSVVLI